MTFRINRVYTRSGDDGETGLVGGRRVRKTDLLVEAYGEIDELNACLGLVKEVCLGPTAELQPLLEYIQQELFDLGSELATHPEDYYKEMWRVTPAHTKYLEELCDFFSQDLAELTSFILPGGSLVAANLHLARTVCRRAERAAARVYDSRVGTGETTTISLEVLRYLNRLGDLMFVLARWALLKEERDAPLWTKGEKRERPVRCLPLESEPLQDKSVKR